MNIVPPRRLAMLAFLIFALAGRHGASAEELTLTFTPETESLAAGDNVRLWLNVLNSSAEAKAWTFPSKIERQISSPQGELEGVLNLRPGESEAVTIASGSFARREYSLTLPAGLTGQLVVRFPEINANRLVLEVKTTGQPAIGPEAKSDSAFDRFIKEVEPEEAGKAFDPGRFFKEHVSGYEPLYFIAGTKTPNAKFQVSFAYQLLNRDGSLATAAPALKGLNLAYTQTSLWDWNTASATFYDTSYKPEFFYVWRNVTSAQPTNWFQLDLQGGVKHESNGKGGVDSRSLNLAYLRPKVTLGNDDAFQLTVQPRAWVYVGDLNENRDIDDYRGYVDLRTTLGWRRGLQLSAIGRMGKDGNHQSLQLDLTYPTMKLFGSFSLYLNVQYFTGYGESLLGYNQRSEALRVGFAIFR